MLVTDVIEHEFGHTNVNHTTCTAKPNNWPKWSHQFFGNAHIYSNLKVIRCTMQHMWYSDAIYVIGILVALQQIEKSENDYFFVRAPRNLPGLHIWKCINFPKICLFFKFVGSEIYSPCTCWNVLYAFSWLYLSHCTSFWLDAFL